MPPNARSVPLPEDTVKAYLRPAVAVDGEGGKSTDTEDSGTDEEGRYAVIRS
jgi:hypothetical protein